MKEYFLANIIYFGGFPGGTAIKNQPANLRDKGDVGSIPGLGRSSGVGNGNPFQYSYLESFMDRGARWAIVRGAAKSHMWLGDQTTANVHALLCVFTRFTLTAVSWGLIFLKENWIEAPGQLCDFLKVTGSQEAEKKSRHVLTELQASLGSLYALLPLSSSSPSLTFTYWNCRS